MMEDSKSVEETQNFLMEKSKLAESPDATSDFILLLLKEQSVVLKLLNQEVMSDEVVVVFAKALSQVMIPTTCEEKQNKLMKILLESKIFTQHFPMFIAKNGKKSDFDIEIFTSIGKICYTVTKQMPECAWEDLQLSVAVCEQTMIMREQLKLPVPPVAKELYKCIQDKFLELAEKQKQMCEQVAIIPSIDEIMIYEEKQLCPVVIKGTYKDLKHYLYTHFHLLRGALIEPLKTGIIQYLGITEDKNQTKIKGKHVYENVRFLKPSFNKSGVSYDIQLEITEELDYNVTRSLIYGSLVCLSADNFKTVLLATVSSRTTENLKQGILKVVLLDGTGIRSSLSADKLCLSYTMVASQAYYEVYKNVLLRLKNIDAQNFPLQNYIISVQQKSEPPVYLKYETTYNISCIIPNQSASSTALTKKQKLTSNAENSDSISHVDNVDPCLQLANLSECHIQVQNLTTWPSADELGLDDSQRKALHFALSSAMTVIHGPPGTGKTYLGLKIVKVLLNNRHIWQRQNSGPILVICPTDKSVDQFLEGLLSFTKRIIRVGSRSTTEALQRFNIRSIRESLQHDKLQAENIFYNLKHMKRELQLIKGKCEEIKTRFQLFKKKILHEDSLQILQEFGNEFYSLLLNDFETYHIQNDPYMKECRPDSYLSAWLGLDLSDWVADQVIEDFSYKDPDSIPNVKRSVNQTWKDQTEPNVYQINSNPVDDEMKFDSIENQDDEMTEENNRILDMEIAEDLLPITNGTQKMIWALDVETLCHPSQQIHPNKLQDLATFIMYCFTAKTKQYIAVRELNQQDSMNENEAKVEMIYNEYNLWGMSLENRWRLYRLIIKKFIQSAETELELLQQEFNKIAKQVREVENQEDLAIFDANDVIGMTITGAAKYHEILQALSPAVVIVEEASEVPEPFLVTCLTPKTQHLILLGDHQQPRPYIDTFGKDKQLDLSLFERMINNGVHHETLKVNYRMRPEISRLLVPLIYNSLEDHPSVREYPAIKGTANSLYFINHSVKEDVLENANTHSNQYEAEYLVEFCHYLLQQGYLPDRITILTMYVGQIHSLKNLMRKEIFNGVRVALVGNFKGEESDIVLVSFVRSIDDENVENLINVCLSRARQGLFCIGNFTLFASKCEIWQRLVASLEYHNLIGDGVEIDPKCKKHSDSVHFMPKVVNPIDFKKFGSESHCLKICGEILPCRHICDKVCHFSDHGSCLQPCNKMCESGHLCPFPCNVKCKPCIVSVVKPLLTCKHHVRLPCYQDVSEVACTAIVERILPKCKHVHELACHVDPKTYKCEVIVERKFDRCNHVLSISCYQNTDQLTCSKPCIRRLDCGHQCNKTCHLLEDPFHLNIQCVKPCTKLICDRKIKCERLCYQECDKCQMIVKKDLPCGHSAEMECQLSANLFNCSKKCIRILPCGHICPLKCNEKCGGCKELVVKQLPHCLHSVSVSCSESLELVACKEKCNRPLPCGHPCQGKCSELCNPKCTYGIQIQADCGHVVEVPCHAKDVLPEILNRYCTYPCNKMLPNCEHMCKGTCGECRQGRVHIPCKEKCEKPLICGHLCTYPCSKWCPPCREKCQHTCNHSKCFNNCGEPCVVCKELCSWKCKHKQCNNYCGELCDREPCDVPCPKRLPCGHPCIGLCGEPCPSLCRTCNFEELTEFQLYGNETNKDAHFVYLPDCKHTIEVEGMDHWMKMRDTETTGIRIQMKCCPRCRTTIWNCPRYGNIVKSIFKDIQSVKGKLFGSNVKQVSEMSRLVEKLQNNCSILKPFKANYENLRHKVTGKHNLHQHATAVIENQINILKKIADLKVKFVKNVYKEARIFADCDFEFLIQRLFLNQEHISNFELAQIISEIDRIALYVEMLEVEHQCKLSGFKPHAKENLDKAKAIFAIGNVINVKEADSIKNYLEAAATRKGLGIGETERIMIVKAIGLTPGHWYKCPNGHVYAIGESGGAIEVSKCNECGAQIGGQSHDLLTSNAHAGEMDGSRHAAWGDAAIFANYGRNAFN